jgi:hypothetical protein
MEGKAKDRMKEAEGRAQQREDQAASETPSRAASPDKPPPASQLRIRPRTTSERR